MISVTGMLKSINPATNRLVIEGPVESDQPAFYRFLTNPGPVPPAFQYFVSFWQAATKLDGRYDYNPALQAELERRIGKWVSLVVDDGRAIRLVP
jgi:hypothetical protein